uniref:Putative secreted protein n=1 Tax=Corethrella appendiculata TaxID=1370023 RepID=U5EMJ5_9DIPT
MKAAIFLVSLVVIASAATYQQRGLNEDLEDFMKLVPVDKITKLAVEYFTTDKEVQDAFKYLQGKEFASVWDQFFALKQVKDLLKYLNGAGLDVYTFLNEVADLFGVAHVKPSVRSLETRKTGHGISGLVDEVLALLPKDKLKALFEEKLKTSAEFKKFFDKLQHADFKELADFYQNSKEVQAAFQKLREHGIDVDKFFELVKGFFGWGKF